MTEKVYEQPNPLIGSDGEELFVVEKIVEERRVDGYLEYKVRWEGYPPSEDVWKDAKEMKQTCGEVVQQWKEDKKARRRLERNRSRSRSRSTAPFKAVDESLQQLGVINDMDTNMAGIAIDSSVPKRIMKKKVRPQLEKSTALKNVKNELLEKPDTESDGPTNEMSCSLSDPNWMENCLCLDDMVNKGDADIIFTDIKYANSFTKKDAYSSTEKDENYSGVVYLKVKDDIALNELQDSDIDFVYGIYRSSHNNVHYVLVKVRKSPPNIVASYPLDDFFKKFPQRADNCLNIGRHYYSMYDTFVQNVDKLKKKYSKYKNCWDEIKNLPDAQKVGKLPKNFNVPNETPEQMVNNFLRDIVDTNNALYFNILGVEYGKRLFHSSKGCGVLNEVMTFHKTRGEQFKSVKKDMVQKWFNDYMELYSYNN